MKYVKFMSQKNSNQNNMKLKATLIILALMCIASCLVAQTKQKETDCETQIKLLEKNIKSAKELIKPKRINDTYSYSRGMLFIKDNNVLGKLDEIHYSEIIKLKENPEYINVLKSKYYNLKLDKLKECYEL